MVRARQLHRAYANLQRELTRHHEGEDQYVFPYLARVGLPHDLLTAMDDEHHAMADALGETRAAMTTYAASGSAADAESARASVARTRVVVDRHLDHEEEDLEPLLEPLMPTDGWKAVEKQLRRASPVVIGTVLRLVAGRHERGGPELPARDDPAAGHGGVQQGRRTRTTATWRPTWHH